MSSPSRTRSSARTRSPLALHAFPETSLLPATSALPATSMAFDETPCTCSVCCILKPPHVTFHCRILRARRPSRPSAKHPGTRLLDLHALRLLAPGALSLRPRETLGLPSCELPSVPVGIEWPFEPIRHVAAARVACRRHRLGRLQTSLPGTTDEEQFAIAAGADGVERLSDAFDEGCIESVVRETLPLDQYRPLADRRQIRKADISPLRNRPHVDQHRAGITLQPRPRIFD